MSIKFGIVRARCRIGFLSLPVIAASTFLLPSPHASAGALDLTCTPPSSETVTYNPPVTMTPQPTTATVSTVFGPCVSATNPAVTAGSRSLTAPLTRSCLQLLDSGGPYLVTITWNTGQTSTLTLNRVTNVAGAVITVTQTGTVTGGLFSGDTVVMTATAPSTDVLNCTLGLGTVSSTYSTVVLEITSA
ncbi:hypothetical protein OHB26_34515 [Nocardia sp. NBC_01503]|uniref:hypothetical protein n=1 Tax=Nocardia sp. NBC_01503 TaxID=2975997 RepID=UPI002E7B7F12|nr:hypothetical protein [Nocardia sp. NBC_01503]WTL31958.1 hypothetical protein OHB26_34515 [Nocardia sp. NBC_01503]